MLALKISKIELKHCHSRQEQNVWLQNSDSRKFEEAVIRESAENPTPTWLRFQLLDNASGETATHQT